MGVYSRWGHGPPNPPQNIPEAFLKNWLHNSTGRILENFWLTFLRLWIPGSGSESRLDRESDPWGHVTSLSSSSSSSQQHEHRRNRVPSGAAVQRRGVGGLPRALRHRGRPTHQERRPPARPSQHRGEVVTPRRYWDLREFRGTWGLCWPLTSEELEPRFILRGPFTSDPPSFPFWLWNYRISRSASRIDIYYNVK